MQKYSFLDDYSEGCHPKILKAMADTNMAQQIAYGNDDYSENAKQLLRGYLGKEDVSINFVGGGTLANIIIISSALRSHEAVISAASGHIVVRETGAIEATGHKIITVSSDNGKLDCDDIECALANNAHYPHMAKPRLVYISNATELGTIFSKSELQAVSEFCRANELLLLLDGARLGTALSAGLSDLSLADITELTDVFWIGGTKAGALLGEAIVVPNKKLADDLSFHIKQRGGLLAKGRVLGLQFYELFKEGLFFEATKRSNILAKKLSDAILNCGYRLSAQTESNQIFPILPNTVIETLSKTFDFYKWEKLNNEETVIRLVTSWATDEDQVDKFIGVIEKSKLTN